MSSNNLIGKVRAKSGFSLIELVVVVLIVGILAAVAAPKMFNTATNARQSATKASLVIIRDAIELYKSDNGSYPPAATLATALTPYIKGQFPSVQVTTANPNNSVVASAANPITPSGTAGWAYNETTGEFVVNHATCITW